MSGTMLNEVRPQRRTRGLRRKLLSSLMGGDFEERSNGETRKRLPSRGMLLLLSVTQPSHVSMTSVGFATLVHTRCAFIVSGAASNNFEPFYLQAREER